MKFLQAGFLCLVLPAISFSQAGKDVFQLKSRIDFSPGLIQTSFSENENKLFLIGKEEIQLWDVSANKFLRAYPHSFPLIAPGDLLGRLFNVRNPMIFSPDGSKGILLLSKEEKGNWSATVWDLRTGNRTGVLQRPDKAIRSANFSEDGKTIISTHGDPAETELVFWDGENFAYRNSLLVRDLSWHHLSRDGEKIFIGTGKANKWAGQILGYDDAGKVELWNARTAKVEKTFRAQNVKFKSVMGPGPMLSKDEKFLAARSGNNVAVWDTSGDGSPKFEIKPADIKKNIGLINLSDDGRYVVASGNGNIGIYELETGKLYKTIAFGGDRSELSPDNKYFIVRYTGAVAVFEVETGKLLYTLTIKTYTTDDPYGGASHTGESESAKVSPSGRFIMIYGDKEVGIFDIAGGKRVQTLVDPRTAKYKDNGKIKDSGLNTRKADWIGSEDSLYVFGKENRFYLLWDAN